MWNNYGCVALVSLWAAADESKGAARLSAMTNSPVAAADGRKKRGKRSTAYNLYQRTVTQDLHDKFGGADAFNIAARSRFASQQTTVGRIDPKCCVCWPYN